MRSPYAPALTAALALSCGAATPTPEGPRIGEASPLEPPRLEEPAVAVAPPPLEPPPAPAAPPPVAPAPPPVAATPAPQGTLTAMGMMAPVHADPSTRSVWLGYVRRGVTVPYARGPVAGIGCDEGGWYELTTGGWLCAGRGAQLTRDVSSTQRRRFPTPARDAPMPYDYAIAWSDAVVYRALPTADDIAAVEPPAAPPAPAPPPETLAAGPRARPTLDELRGLDGTPVVRRLTRGMHVSLDRAVRASTGRWWRTQAGGFVRTSALGVVGARAWQGARLDDGTRLPLAFVASSEASLMRRTATGFAPAGRVPRLSMHRVGDGEAVAWRGDVMHPVEDGLWLRARHARVVTARPRPEGVGADERWVDVNVTRQFAVAYEGDRAVYATLVSTGIPGRGELDHSTVEGEFRIEAKHLTATMDGDTASSGPYSIEDVPWVMYFHGSYALHGAFWHTGFGRVHSHGCVNLSPPDARWFFGWTSPALPDGWHGVVASRERPGTRVFVHRDERP